MSEPGSHFLRTIIANDLKEGRHDGRVQTRFPPEPNGYLHIGHAKSICLNFGLAQEFGGLCNLRFDDTNPAKEDVEYVDAIKEDVRWLGFSWGDREYYASDYFENLYRLALNLIESGNAYVCDLTADEIRSTRGTLTSPGQESPFRNRSVRENLDLFTRMRAGEFAAGSKVLRAKIDMSSPNLNMRDPVLYRVLFAPHHRTGDSWCLYPMYDFAHPLSDALESITHSVCTLEFEDHRPLYDWLVERLFPENLRPRQYEFARLDMTHTVMSKRKLRELVENNVVSGWDDPRMPTISGLRRRGYSASAIRTFCENIGVARANSLVDVAMLENCAREELNLAAKRVMAVLEPLKLVITNYPPDQYEKLIADNNPEDPSMGTREIDFGRELYIEQTDFMEDPPNKFFRLKPGGEVRLKHAYIIRCDHVVKDADGVVIEVHCSYDPDSKTGGATSGRKVKGTLHWVACNHALPAEIRLYDYLYSETQDVDTATSGLLTANLTDYNPTSLICHQGWVEQSLLDATPEDRFQFLRQGYFCLDSQASALAGSLDTGGSLVFNRIVGLRDSYRKQGNR
ncbi:MAG: glutamine--tRNA ligase/YqeY domain fusion protein [Peptococcaceae bacterium]|nr:glutamine--tRNA ligase/YqeY domain fusion protein [Peptococcaceae bacterium]